ncbi:MAG: hypothetical protein ABXS92_05205 [Sulfurimonas sp.]
MKQERKGNKFGNTAYTQRGSVWYAGTFRIYDFAAGLALCEGLEVVVDEDYVIVSKDKKTADKIVGLIQSIEVKE